MTNYSYTVGIPDAPNNPSSDQPVMKINNDSNESIWKIDHYGFNDNLGGEHKYVTYGKNAISDAVPAAPTNPNSVSYAAAGVADVTRPQMYFKNDKASFILSSIRAFGSFKSPNAVGVFSLENSYNVVSIDCTSLGSSDSYTVVLETNCTDSDKVVVFQSSNDSAVTYDWSYVAPNLTLRYKHAAATKILGFIVIQA